jgi:uncharacterized protein (TIGR03437 family)
MAQISRLVHSCHSFVTIFGADLSYYTLHGESSALPNEVQCARLCEQLLGSLIYVCPTQINLLVPGNLKPGTVPLYIVRQGVRGPAAMLAPAAPQLFATTDGRVIAQHADYSLITAESPAIAGRGDHRLCRRPGTH